MQTLMENPTQSEEIKLTTTEANKIIKKWNSYFRERVKNEKSHKTEKMRVSKVDEEGFQQIVIGEKNYGITLSYKFEEGILYFNQFRPVSGSMIRGFCKYRAPLAMEYVFGIAEALKAEKVLLRTNAYESYEKNVIQNYLFESRYEEDSREYDFELNLKDGAALRLVSVKKKLDEVAAIIKKEQPSFVFKQEELVGIYRYQLYYKGVDTFVSLKHEEDKAILKDIKNDISVSFKDAGEVEEKVHHFLEQLHEHGQFNVLLNPTSQPFNRFAKSKLTVGKAIRDEMLTHFLQEHTIVELDKAISEENYAFKTTHRYDNSKVLLVRILDMYLISDDSTVSSTKDRTEAFELYTEYSMVALRKNISNSLASFDDYNE